MSKDYTGERFLPEECRGEIAIEHYQRYQFARQLIKGKTVLDAACGEGYGSSLLSQAASHVTGLDLDKGAVERASRKYGSEKLSFRAGSIEKLPFEDQSFDAVVSYETIEHVDGEIQKQFLSEIRRVLKPDGLLIMSTPNKAVYTDLVKGQNQFHVKEFYVKEYQDFLHGFFKEIEMFCQYPDVGYFISRENEAFDIYNRKEKSQEESRYVLAMCSNVKLQYTVDTGSLTAFDDSMYYDLNRLVHEKEQEILQLKAEAEAFQRQLEADIGKLEKENRLLREAWRHPLRLGKYLAGQRKRK